MLRKEATILESIYLHYAELLKVTNNFYSSKELGDGGFDTVYYGKDKDPFTLEEERIGSKVSHKENSPKQVIISKAPKHL